MPAHRITCVSGLGVLLLALAALAAWFVLPSPAYALAPHVVTQEETDSCAMCHRGHTGASKIQRRDSRTGEETGSALIVGVYETDSQLCFSCHGVTALGASADVETPFSFESSHSLDTTIAPGVTPKRCASCHDSHGSDRRADGTPFPSLLRGWESTDTPVFKGDELCATCHKGTATDRWDGLALWRQTAHSKIATPTSGAQIICSACHEPHGSDAPPMIAPYLYPPSAPTTIAVEANDRSQCLACHAGSDATYPGAAIYQTSGHGGSEATVAATGDWADRATARASAVTTRAVGDCQTCHAPMGRADGDGELIPKLVDKPGRELCDTCHRADSSTEATDVASLAFPESEASAPELIASFEPASPTAYLGSMGVWSRDSTGTAPREIVGPREYRTGGRAGAVAAGAIEGDGQTHLLVADAAGRKLEVYSPSATQGIERSAVYPLLDDASNAIVPDLVAVADYILDPSGRPEIAVVDRAAATLYAFRRQAGGISLVATAAVGSDASSIASGDVRGSDRPDIVVTSLQDDEFRIISESAGALTVAATVTTRSGPTGASIGDAWNDGSGQNDIVIANSGVSTGTVSIFPADGGAAYASYDATGVAGARAVATIVANVLPDTPSPEVAVALRSDSPTGTSGVTVFERAGAGLGTAQEYLTGAGAHTVQLAAGDLDGDAQQELIVANAGRWTRDVDEGVAPSVWVMHSTDGQQLDISATNTLYAGGVERAGSTLPVIVADLGGVGPSRHPVGAVEDAHVSTETAPVARHVECVDCHNVHESTSTPAPGAPVAYGVLRGSSGVSIESTTGSTLLRRVQPVTNEYEVCIKCHSSDWAVLDPSRDIASRIETVNASVHAVVAPSTTAVAPDATFTDSKWTKDAVLYCIDCHSSAGPGTAKGPHASPDAPVLRKKYFGLRPSSTSLLCYDCHKRSVYYTGADVALSRFRDSGMALHERHVESLGFGCASCHVSHGSPTEEHLIRDDIGYTHEASGGGSCANECHTTGSPSDTHAYSGS